MKNGCGLAGRDSAAGADARKRGRPKAFYTPASKGGVQAVTRALDILEALAAHDGVTLTQLAEFLGQSVATVHRVLGALGDRRFAELVADRQEWHVGPEAFRLGSAFLRRHDVIEQSRPAMRELTLCTGETSNLGVERNTAVLFVSQVETTETIRAFLPPGTLAPLHASGIGKALLSKFDEGRFSKYLKDCERLLFSPKTLVSEEQLRGDLKLTLERGYAFDDEERTVGMRCVAAAIMNIHGEAVAGVSVSGPTSRLPDKAIPVVGRAVLEAAASISRSLGSR